VDAPTDEVPSLWSVVPVAEHAPEFHRPADPIPDEEAAVLRDLLPGRLRRQESGEGARLRRDDELVRENPEFFRTVVIKRIGEE
jgi:hypothetical protein